MLVVAWESELRDGISNVAGNSGYQVAACPTAHEAVKLCEANNFNVLVLDGTMYGMECAQFIEWLRGEGECTDTYVLVMVPTGATADARRLLAAGADDSVNKPVSAEDLNNRLVVMEYARKRKEKLIQGEAVLRRNHTRFESIFMESPDAVLILKNREGKIIGVNRAVKTVLGFDGKALLGKYLSLVFPELFDGEGLSTFGSFLKNSSSVHSLAFKCPDGSKKMLDLGLTSIPWDRGFALMLSCRDVSAREGSDTKRDGRDREESIRRLAAGVSGDVNDLMTSIHGNLELLENQPFVGQESMELLSRARQSCDRVRELTAEMNLLAGIGGRPRKGRISLKGMIEKTVQFSLFGEGRMRPLFRFQAGLFDIVGDEKLLRQVIEQLTSNAAESMRMRNAVAGKLHVDCANVHIASEGPHRLKKGNYVRITVRDEGEGISEELRETVFEPYFTTRKSGRGVGLARVRATILAHGGQITVEAPSGNTTGAVFEIHLPVAEPGTEDVSYGQSDANGLRKVGEGKRILFLDDEPHIRLVVEKALSSHGYEVYCASTGEEAIKAFKRALDFGKPFDMLLLDLEIRGGLGGCDTLGIIREDHPNVRAIVTTGFVNDAVLSNHRDFGFCGVLAKPFRVDQLVACVGQLCGAGKR